MSGQDYVYIVWTNGVIPYDYIVTTAPTKYQAQHFIDKLIADGWNPNTHLIQRWRHGDTEGHWCD